MSSEGRDGRNTDTCAQTLGFSLQNAKTGKKDGRAGPAGSHATSHRALENTTTDQPIHVVHEIQMSLFFSFFFLSFFLQ